VWQVEIFDLSITPPFLTSLTHPKQAPLQSKYNVRSTWGQSQATSPIIFPPGWHSEESLHFSLNICSTMTDIRLQHVISTNIWQNPLCPHVDSSGHVTMLQTVSRTLFLDSSGVEQGLVKKVARSSEPSCLAGSNFKIIIKVLNYINCEHGNTRCLLNHGMEQYWGHAEPLNREIPIWDPLIIKRKRSSEVKS
jgi:hypothetical protein